MNVQLQTFRTCWWF